MGAMTSRDRKIVARWLILIAAMIFVMTIIGGLTRLTESGLSIVEWEPIMGAVPPLNAEDWQEAFDKYKVYPQYIKSNPDMTMSEFKFIFFMEWFHRLFGRLIGLVHFFPFCFFLWKKMLDRKTAIKAFLIFVLGGVQGFIGWYMVASGLVNEPRVSQERLTLHFSVAFTIFAAALWLAWDIRRPEVLSTLPNKLKWLWLTALSFVVLQMMSGGLVAGLRAGYFSNTWPKMGEVWIPEYLWTLHPWWANLVDNPTMVQFFHRTNAMVATALVLSVFWLSRNYRGQLGRAWFAVAPVLLLQVGLGISTLVMRVPVSLASMHQGVALILLTVVLRLYWRSTQPEQRIAT